MFYTVRTSLKLKLASDLSVQSKLKGKHFLADSVYFHVISWAMPLLSFQKEGKMIYHEHGFPLYCVLVATHQWCLHCVKYSVQRVLCVCTITEDNNTFQISGLITFIWIFYTIAYEFERGFRSSMSQPWLCERQFTTLLQIVIYILPTQEYEVVFVTAASCCELN